MSAMMKNDGRTKIRANPRPSTETLLKLWANGSTPPTLRRLRNGKLGVKTPRVRLSQVVALV